MVRAHRQSPDSWLREADAPRAAFAFLRVSMALVWLFEVVRGAPWEIPAAIAGVMLLFGIKTPLGALIGAGISVYVLTQTRSPDAWGAWPWLYWLMILLHLLLAATRAGRVAGVDALFAARRPQSPLW